MIRCELQRRYETVISPLAVAYISSCLRDVDRYEAISFGSTPGENDQAVVDLSALSGCVWYRERPAFLFGALETEVPGVFSIWGWGTDDTRRVLPKLTKVCLETVGPSLFRDHSARRLSVQLPYSPLCETNIKWLMRLGFKPEGIARCATMANEDVLTLAFTKPDFEQYVSSKLTKSSSANSPAGSTGAGKDG